MYTAWNTGRQYSRAGQRITASHTTRGGVVRFYDHDRHICGTFKLEKNEAPAGLESLKKIVMQRYDFLQYDMAFPKRAEIKNALTAPSLEAA
jgi:hypothetical protein